MIIRPDRGTLLFITQPDHAAAAADLVRHFEGLAEHPRREDVLLAVREHDCGWQEMDADVAFDAVAGRALDFMAVAERVKQSVWPVAIDRIALRSLYAAALIAEHALFVYGGNREKPDWQPFFTAMEARRAELLTWAGEPLETLRADYPLLGLADLLSLSFCNGWTEPRKRFGRAVRCDGDAVTMTPSLLHAEAIPLRVRMRRLADRAYESHRALREGLERAPDEFLTGVARAGTAS